MQNKEIKTKTKRQNQSNQQIKNDICREKNRILLNFFLNIIVRNKLFSLRNSLLNTQL